jgi:hypothetical protein
MDDNFPNQLRKQFSIDRVLENPGFVAAVYVNERDHAADIIEEQQKRIESLEAALRESYKFEETLMRISHLADQHPVFDDALKAYTRCASIARAALAVEKKDG